MLKSEMLKLIEATRVPRNLSLSDLCRQLLAGIRHRRYDGKYPSAIYSAAYGFLWSIQTLRIDSSRATTLEKLQGAAAFGFLMSIIEKNLSGDDVARFCNGRPFIYKEGRGWVAVYH